MASQVRNIRLIAFYLLFSLSKLRVECSNATQAIDCATLTNTTDANLEEWAVTGFKTPPKQNVKCFFKCSMEQFGHWKNGKPQLDALIKDLLTTNHYKGHLADLQKDIKKCKDKIGKDECDTAYGIMACMRESEIYM